MASSAMDRKAKAAPIPSPHSRHGVLSPLLTGRILRMHAEIFSFMAGVLPCSCWGGRCCKSRAISSLAAVPSIFGNAL
jgi:hypothetical protein